MIVEMATISMIFDGVDFLVTMIYLRHGLKVYSEIQNKLSFIHMVKKYDTHGVLKTLNQTQKVFEKVNDVSRLKTEKGNKIKHHSNVYMKRLYSYTMDRLESRELARADKRERRQAKFKLRLDKHHQVKALKKDKEDEVVLCAEGHVRCVHCLHYTDPEKLLVDISQKASEKASLLQFAPDKVAHLKNLILMPDRSKPTKVEDFDEYKKVFYKLVVVCRECKVSFDEVEPLKLWKPDSIVHLQSKRASQVEVTLKDSYDFVK